MTSAGPISDLQAMLSGMAPKLGQTALRFILINPAIAPQALHAAFATIREEEGVTAVIPADLADELEQAGPDFARITLQIHSDLEGVGLTAAIAAALADQGISCNVIAALHHDHLLVPWALRNDALTCLQSLSCDAAV